MALEKEITAAKLAGRSAEEIKLLEKARDERLTLVRKDAAKPDESNGGVHVKKGSLPPNAERELNGSKYTTGTNSAVDPAHLDELGVNGVKFKPENIVATGRSPRLC